MPKYYEFKVAGYYLYFTSKCIIECMHVHASDRKLTEAGSAKFFVKENGDSQVVIRGILSDRDLRKIQEFIKDKIDVVIMCGGSATDLPQQVPSVSKLFNTVDSFDTHAKIPEYFEKVNSSVLEKFLSPKHMILLIIAVPCRNTAQNCY